MVPILDNPHPSVINVGVGLCPPLMGTFDYSPPSGDEKMILVVPDQPRDDIFQVLSFRTTCFTDPLTLPSPSTSMEGTWNRGMSIPLSMEEFAYSIFQQDSTDPDPNPASELDPILKTIWVQGSLVTTNSLDLVFPSNKAILEALTGPDIP
jgi:hypothetical protein